MRTRLRVKPSAASLAGRPSVAVAPEPSDLRMSKAVDQMVVDHAHGLHVRINDRRTDEGETTALQITAQGVGSSGASRDIPYGSPAVLDRAALDEAPLVSVEGSELFLKLEKRLGIPDRRFNLGPVANDPRIRKQRRDLPLVVAGDLPRVEPVEGAPVGVPLAEDRAPAQPRLGTLENEKLEKDVIVVQGNAPLLVVVGDVERVGA